MHDLIAVFTGIRHWFPLRPPTHARCNDPDETIAQSISVKIHLYIFNSVYFCSSDPEGGCGPQDIEHVNSIQLHQYALQYITIDTSSLG